MSESPSHQDRDLLSRLNALKNSSIDLGEKQSITSAPHPAFSSIDLEPSVGRKLYADISARFQALQDWTGSIHSAPSVRTKSCTALNIPELQNENDGKTLDELLAELGPEQDWAVSKGEEGKVRDLLMESQHALKGSLHGEKNDGDPNVEPRIGNNGTQNPGRRSVRMPNVDMSAFQPEPDPDPDSASEKEAQPKDDLNQLLDQEADEYLERIMDEIRQKKNTHSDEEDDLPPPGHCEAKSNTPSSSPPPPPPPNILSSPSLLPSTPSKDPSPREPAAAAATSEPNDLSTSFSSLSLSLPCVPTTVPTPKTKTKTKTKTKVHKHTPPPSSSITYTDAEIETWCIICSDDATVRCIGCEGDLYCRTCWFEGHRGDAATYEERRHRAMEFSKRDKKGKAERALVTG